MFSFAHPSLPVALTTFIGREREIAEVTHLLATARLVSLTGPGGVGKTRLALRIAQRAVDPFAGNVCWVELARLNDPALVPQAIAKALDVAEQSDAPLLTTLLEKLRARKWLLALDNCEHVLAACAEWVEALLRGSDVTILTTSREPIGVAGEMAYPVPPLALPATGLPLAAALQFDAVRLFVERARSIRPEFATTQDSAGDVIEICRRLDGLPLAIELASARVNVLSVHQIAERLDGRLDLLASPARADARHRTMRAAIDWSYNLLSPDEQRLLQHLSIFSAGFTLSIIESACGWGEIPRARMLDLLSSLISKSLVVTESLQGSEARYRLLETIRQFAAEKLLASGARDEAHDHFLDCYVQLADEIAPKLYGQFQQTWFAWLETEHDNFRVALDWALESRRIEAGLRITSALCQFWLTRDSVREGFTWFERFLGLLDETDEAIPLAVKVNALTFATFLASFLGDAATAAAWSGRALALCEAGGAEGRSLLGFALAGVDSAVETTGDYQAAYDITVREIELDRESGNPLLLGMALFTQGMRAIRLGKLDAARAHLEEALAVAQADNDPYRVAHVQNVMGDLARMEGRLDEAAARYEQSLAGFRDLGAARDVPNVERHLAYTLLRQGDASRAHMLFCQSLEARSARDNRAGMLRGLMGLATWAAAVNMPEANARLRGFVLGRQESLGPSFDSGDVADEADDERFAAMVRVRVDDARLEAAQAEGRAMTLDQAMEYALNLRLPADMPPAEVSVLAHGLTTREREIAVLIARGLSNGEIAGELVLSKRTVEKHIANILSKLALANRAQIVRWAVDHGLS